MMELEINGVKYIERPKSSTNKKGLNKLLLASMMMSGINSVIPNRKSLDVNIIEEYKLIQNKKSKLSSNDRRIVCNRFERLYKKID